MLINDFEKDENIESIIKLNVNEEQGINNLNSTYKDNFKAFTELTEKYYDNLQISDKLKQKNKHTKKSSSKDKNFNVYHTSLFPYRTSNFEKKKQTNKYDYVIPKISTRIENDNKKKVLKEINLDNNFDEGKIRVKTQDRLDQNSFSLKKNLIKEEAIENILNLENIKEKKKRLESENQIKKVEDFNIENILQIPSKEKNNIDNYERKILIDKKKSLKNELIKKVASNRKNKGFYDTISNTNDKYEETKDEYQKLRKKYNEKSIEKTNIKKDIFTKSNSNNIQNRDFVLSNSDNNFHNIKNNDESLEIKVKDKIDINFEENNQNFETHKNENEKDVVNENQNENTNINTFNTLNNNSNTLTISTKVKIVQNEIINSCLENINKNQKQTVKLKAIKNINNPNHSVKTTKSSKPNAKLQSNRNEKSLTRVEENSTLNEDLKEDTNLVNEIINNEKENNNEIRQGRKEYRQKVNIQEIVSRLSSCNKTTNIIKEAQLMNKSVSVDKIVKRSFLKAFSENKTYYVSLLHSYLVPN